MPFGLVCLAFAQDQPGQLQGFNWDAMLKDPHVAAGDFIDQGDMLVWTDPAELEFDIIEI